MLAMVATIEEVVIAGMVAFEASYSQYIRTDGRNAGPGRRARPT